MDRNIAKLLTDSFLKYEGKCNPCSKTGTSLIEPSLYGTLQLGLPKESGVEGSLVDIVIKDPELAVKNISKDHFDDITSQSGVWKFYYTKDEPTFTALYYAKKIKIPGLKQKYKSFPTAIISGELPREADISVADELRKLDDNILSYGNDMQANQVDKLNTKIGPVVMGYKIGNEALVELSKKWEQWNKSQKSKASQQSQIAEKED